jgi:hypothetical protein
MTPKSLKEFPEDVQQTVYKILANVAERKSKSSQAKGA